MCVAKNASVEININFAYPVKWAKRNDETTRRVKNRHRHRSDETTGRSNKVRRENGEIKRKWWTKRRNEATKWHKETTKQGNDNTIWLRTKCSWWVEPCWVYFRRKTGQHLVGEGLIKHPELHHPLPSPHFPGPSPFPPQKKKTTKQKKHAHTLTPPFHLSETLLLWKPIRQTFSIAETKGSISDTLMLKFNASNSHCVLY